MASSPRELLERARLMHRERRATDAQGLYRGVIRHNPKEYAALAALGVLLAENGRLDDAASETSKRCSGGSPSPTIFGWISHPMPYRVAD